MGWGSVEKCGKHIEDVYMLTGVAIPVANTSLIQKKQNKKTKKNPIHIPERLKIYSVCFHEAHLDFPPYSAMVVNRQIAANVRIYVFSQPW